MSKSDYNYTRIKNIISIIDLNLGRMTVTNNIENVVSEIAKKERIAPEEFKWIYRDTDGLWDGWNPTTNTFIPLQTHLESDAREQIVYKS